MTGKDRATNPSDTALRSARRSRSAFDKFIDQEIAAIPHWAEVFLEPAGEGESEEEQKGRASQQRLALQILYQTMSYLVARHGLPFRDFDRVQAKVISDLAHLDDGVTADWLRPRAGHPVLAQYVPRDLFGSERPTPAEVYSFVGSCLAASDVLWNWQSGTPQHDADAQVCRMAKGRARKLSLKRELPQPPSEGKPKSGTLHGWRKHHLKGIARLKEAFDGSSGPLKKGNEIYNNGISQFYRLDCVRAQHLREAGYFPKDIAKHLLEGGFSSHFIMKPSNMKRQLKGRGRTRP